MTTTERINQSTTISEPFNFPLLPLPLIVSEKIENGKIDEALAIAKLRPSVLERAEVGESELGQTLKLLYEVNPFLHPHHLSNVIPQFRRFNSIPNSCILLDTEVPSLYERKIVGFTGPSASGKDTIYDILIGNHPTNQVTKIKNATTRSRRASEGQDKYYFITEAEFLNMVTEGEMLEMTPQYSHYYGTPKIGVEKALREADTVFSFAEITNAQLVLDYAAQHDPLIKPYIIYTLPQMSWQQYSLEWIPSQRNQQIFSRVIRSALEIMVAAKSADVILLNPYNPENPGVEAAEDLKKFLHLT